MALRLTQQFSTDIQVGRNVHFVYDSPTNTLRLQLDSAESGAVRSLSGRGIIDIAEGGRLVGIEMAPPDDANAPDWLREWKDDPVAGEWVTVDPDGRVYIQLTAGDDRHSRSTPVELTLALDASGQLVAVGIPRRGEGYEISYPSGNQ